MYDIIIVGAGPAGLTAALYALRANKKVLIFEAKAVGGQILLATKVENYPGIEAISGEEYSKNLYNQVKNLGAEFKYETVIRIDENRVVYTNNPENDITYEAKAVIIATGVENRKLNIEGEKDYLGKGVSYCATCDGPFFKNKEVAIVGGGNTALEDAVYLSAIAKKVYLIHRRDTFRGEDMYLKELKKTPNVEFILNSNVTKIEGKDKLESLEITNTNEEVSTLKVDGLFVAVGQSPRNEIFNNVVDIDERGYIISEDGVHTKTKHIYVAGDAREKDLRQLTTAVSDGSIAATVAIREM